MVRASTHPTRLVQLGSVLLEDFVGQDLIDGRAVQANGLDVDLAVVVAEDDSLVAVADVALR